MTTSLTWPASFPTPLLSGSGYTLAQLNQRTDFAIGARIRPLYSDGADISDQVSVIFTKSQLAYFQGIYRYQWGNGAFWINMPVEAAGIKEQREVRITTSPHAVLMDSTPANRKYLVSFQIETRQGTTMDEATFDIVDQNGGVDETAALLQAIADAANYDYAGS